MTDKPTYETPSISDHGDLTQLTAASTTSGAFDATFPVNSPIPPNFGSAP